ncbi:MAG: acyl-CoA dehydrogenase, partial [Acidobacteriota bacterium]|nr:acyl-CoA dehydrogenase [Acidobacteriota bacterium]
GMAYQKYRAKLEAQQEVMMGIADIVLEAFAMESCLLRSRAKSVGNDMCAVFLRDAMARVEFAARGVVGACAPAGTVRSQMSVVRKLSVYDPIDGVGLRRGIAKRLLERERY